MLYEFESTEIIYLIDSKRLLYRLLPGLYLINVDILINYFHHVMLELWPLFYGRKPLTCICDACKPHISNAPYIKDLEFVH